MASILLKKIDKFSFNSNTISFIKRNFLKCIIPENYKSHLICTIKKQNSGLEELNMLLGTAHDLEKHFESYKNKNESYT